MPKLRVIIKPPPEPQGEPEQQVEALRDYLLQMSEELAYVLTHLEADNINDSTFERIQGMIPRPYTGLPVMDGDASPGQSAQWARGDHRHGSDTSKADLTALEETAEDLADHIADKGNPHEVTKAQVGLSDVANERQYSAQNPPPTPTPGEVGAIPASEKGSAGGVAELDANGMVPSAQLPSYVDDVLEYATQAGFPVTGENGKIYVALDTNRTYRWSGSAYVEISESLALGETSSTAYRGDRGKAAYDHSQTVGNPHGTTAADVGARPDTWMPTAADVGARADTWMPTASDVGARPDTWTPTAADVGARPDNWVPDAEDVPYDPTQSGLMATDVQAAIDELAQGGGGGGTAAAAVSYDNTGSGIAATNVQDAIDEVYGDIPAQASDIGAAERFHASAYTVFGLGTANVYGHLKLSDAADASKDSTAGTAATPFAIYNLQLETLEKANWDSITERAEFGSTSTHAYQPGEYFRSSGAIYKVKQPIAVGDTFTASNSELTTVLDPLAGAIFGKTIGSWSGTTPFSVYMGNDSAHLLIITSSSSLKQAMVLVNCSSSGAVVYAEIYKGSYISISTATGRIDFTLTTSGNTTRVTDMPLVGNYATVSS